MTVLLSLQFLQDVGNLRGDPPGDFLVSIGCHHKLGRLFQVDEAYIDRACHVRLTPGADGVVEVGEMDVYE